LGFRIAGLRIPSNKCVAVSKINGVDWDSSNLDNSIGSSIVVSNGHEIVLITVRNEARQAVSRQAVTPANRRW
jgi:hypothetical protein